MSDYKQFCKKHNFPCNAASAAAFDAYTKEDGVQFELGWSRSDFDERFKNKWDRKATDKDWDHFMEMYDEINVDVVCDTLEELMDECLTDSFWNCSECDETVAGTYDADHAPAGWDGRLCQDCFTKMAVPCKNCGDEFVQEDDDEKEDCCPDCRKDDEEEFCEEHEQVMWKDGGKCSGCLDEEETLAASKPYADNKTGNFCLEWDNLEEYFLKDDTTLKTIKKYKKLYTDDLLNLYINYWYGDSKNGNYQLFWTFADNEEEIHNVSYTDSSPFAKFWALQMDGIDG